MPERGILYSVAPPLTLSLGLWNVFFFSHLHMGVSMSGWGFLTLKQTERSHTLES